jgi:hypothetical protein
MERGGGEEKSQNEFSDVELLRDASVGIDTFEHFQKALWWNWSSGSALQTTEICLRWYGGFFQVTSTVNKDGDIRMVYNGTSSGSNNALHAPNFWIPSPASAARVLGVGYFMVDMDLGENVSQFPSSSGP